MNMYSHVVLIVAFSDLIVNPKTAVFIKNKNI